MSKYEEPPAEKWIDLSKRWLTTCLFVGSENDAMLSLARRFERVADKQREADAQVCESVSADCNRESRFEPLMLRNGAGAAMCADAIRDNKDQS